MRQLGETSICSNYSSLQSTSFPPPSGIHSLSPIISFSSAVLDSYSFAIWLLLSEYSLPLHLPFVSVVFSLFAISSFPISTHCSPFVSSLPLRRLFLSFLICEHRTRNAPANNMGTTYAQVRMCEQPHIRSEMQIPKYSERSWRIRNAGEHICARSTE